MVTIPQGEKFRRGEAIISLEPLDSEQTSASIDFQTRDSLTASYWFLPGDGQGRDSSYQCARMREVKREVKRLEELDREASGR